MNIRTLIFLSAVAFLFSRCTMVNMDETRAELELAEQPCLMKDAKALLTYESSSWQLAYNASMNEFRVMNDYMSDYFILTCSGLPTDGGQVTADLVYTTTTDVKTVTGLVFSVVKTTDDGMVWLLDSKSGYAAVVKILE